MNVDSHRLLHFDPDRRRHGIARAAANTCVRRTNDGSGPRAAAEGMRKECREAAS